MPPHSVCLKVLRGWLLTGGVCVCVCTGHYWIDPNEGSPKDAIRVFCKGQETCLTPRKQSNSQVAL